MASRHVRQIPSRCSVLVSLQLCKLPKRGSCLRGKVIQRIRLESTRRSIAMPYYAYSTDDEPPRSDAFISDCLMLENARNSEEKAPRPEVTRNNTSAPRHQDSTPPRFQVSRIRGRHPGKECSLPLFGNAQCQGPEEIGRPSDSGVRQERDERDHC